MLIIEDDPYYFLQFDKVQKEVARLLLFVKESYFSVIQKVK